VGVEYNNRMEIAKMAIATDKGKLKREAPPPSTGGR
jgi:hypothetical protein